MKQAKKILAILLSALMILSIMTVGISANTDAPIVIDSASDWNAYKQADGSYLLPKNGKFTVSATVETLETNFNGNGSIVTTSVPLFKTANNVVIENLTINGKISVTGDCAALATFIKGYSSVKNIVNNANVTSTDGNNGGVGGILAHVSAGLTEVNNCVNNGNVTANNGVQTYPGGIIGTLWKSTAIVTNCVNNGNIISNAAESANTTKLACGAGGIIAYVAGAGSHITITGCGNNGDVTAQWIAGGIVGRNYGRPNIITGCYNTGDISATWAGQGMAGGVDGTGGHASLNYCWNTGDVSGQLLEHQITGHQAIQECIGNYYSDTVTVKAFHFDGSDYTNEGATAFTAAELASGKLAYDINTAAGAQLFFQNLSATNSTPTTDPADGNVLKIGENYLSFSIVTREAASARIEEGNAGLRFATDIRKADYDALVAAGISADTIKVGTVVTPYEAIEEIEDNDEIFTVDKLTEGTYLNIEATLKTDSADYYFRNSIVKISEDNYDTDYAAIGYIQFGETIIYSANYTVRNVEQVATAAYADRADASADGYENSISASSAVAIDSKATYSPYTEAQLTILKAYIAE